MTVEIYMTLQINKIKFLMRKSSGRPNTSAAAVLAEFRKITTFSGKNTIFNEHPVVFIALKKDIDFSFNLLFQLNEIDSQL